MIVPTLKRTTSKKYYLINQKYLLYFFFNLLQLYNRLNQESSIDYLRVAVDDDSDASINEYIEEACNFIGTLN